MARVTPLTAVLDELVKLGVPKQDVTVNLTGKHAKVNITIEGRTQKFVCSKTRCGRSTTIPNSIANLRRFVRQMRAVDDGASR